MAKTEFAGLQSIMQDVAHQALQSAGNEFLDNIQRMGLDIGQQAEVGDAFDNAIGKAQEMASDGVDVITGFIKDNISKELNKIGILPESLKNQIGEAGNEIVDTIGNVSKEAIKHAASAGKEILGAVFKQTWEAVQSVFSNIGAMLKGNKTKEEAIEGIANSWKEAGEKIMETTLKAKKSFVEKIGGSKSQDKSLSHAERAIKSQESTNAGKSR